MSSPKLKPSKQFKMNLWLTGSNALSKSAKNNNPATFSCSNASIVSCIKRIFSPMYRPFINPICGLPMSLDKNCLILFAVVLVAISSQ